MIDVSRNVQQNHTTRYGSNGGSTAQSARSSSAARAVASTKVATKVAATAPTTAAAVVSLSDATASTTETSGTSGTGVLKSFDEIVQDRTKALADKLGDRLTNLGVPQDEPINLQIDSLGQIKTDSP